MEGMKEKKKTIFKKFIFRPIFRRNRIETAMKSGKAWRWEEKKFGKKIGRARNRERGGGIKLAQELFAIVVFSFFEGRDTRIKRYGLIAIYVCPGGKQTNETNSKANVGEGTPSCCFKGLTSRLLSFVLRS